MFDVYLNLGLVLICVVFVTGQEKICPKCTDRYDYQSCTQTQSCGIGWNSCELRVDTSDSFSLEYLCKNSSVCTELESAGCHPELKETCYFCCHGVYTCQIQRDDLYKSTFPQFVQQNTSPLPSQSTPSLTPVSPTQAPTAVSPTTAHPSGTTSRPTVISPSTTSRPTVISPVTTSSPPGGRIHCLQCGDLSKHRPCTSLEIVLSKPKECPANLPYCFSSFLQNGADVQVFKGCEADNFCSLEYELTNAKAQCNDPDISVSGHYSCGYCCNDDACNASLKPDESTLVTYP